MNHGVDHKHEVTIAFRSTPGGPIKVQLLTDQLPLGQQVDWTFSGGEPRVLGFDIRWRDDAGRIRYATLWQDAPSNCFFSTIEAWWEADPDAPRAQSYLPMYVIHRI
jgi:hypothetical protein